MFTIIKKLLNTESIIVAAVIFITIFFAKFPTLYHWLNTPNGYWFPKNTDWYDAWDTNFQVSDIRYGQRSGILAQNTYTTIPHKGAYIYQFYTSLGIINRFLHLDPFVIFHIASIITGIILIFICYLIAKIFFADQIERLSAFIIFALGGGLGFLPYLSTVAADTRVAGFNLINALERGSDALSTSLLLASFLLIYRYIKTYDKKYIFWSLVLGFISITYHPPFGAMYVIVGIIIFFWEFIKTKKYYFALFPVILSILFLIYYVLILSSLLNNPAFAGVVGQSLFNVDSFSLVAGFGVLSLFLLYGLIFSRNTSDEFIFAKLIFIIQLAFLYLPFGFHLYFVKGLYIWGAILAFFAIKEFITNSRWYLRIITAVILLSLISRLYVFNILMKPMVGNSFFFLRADEGKALEYMSSLPKDSGVLSLYRIGNYIPAFSDARVYYGHKFQTPQAGEKLNIAKQFYLSDDDKLQREFLKLNNIQYIYYGLEETKVRQDAKLDTQNPFPKYPVIYRNDSAIIYSATASADKK